MRKTLILDETAVKRALVRITHEIIERNQGVENICLLGVKRRGIPLAEILFENIKKFEGVSVPKGSLDATLHRDDLTDLEKSNLAVGCEFPCEIKDKTVIIVDDVMFTGRTARAAMEAVFNSGRPKSVQLAVLIDRGHRELPIRPDYVGKNVPTSKTEKVSVKVNGVDDENAVYIIQE
ncbi:MAG: bifunctional pyr operon transcriptional regulator/uracil phosphoribosyltransferase PyrR [Clostridia bacterium]|nr:bifunctional pyr operon transcriptional regulator/uracil phosphoribosyltransferase PyrR [Clostridia bacterium]